MYDYEFLTWIHDRLIHLHKEDHDADYMYKLRAIIKATPEDQLTPNCPDPGPLNSLPGKNEATVPNTSVIIPRTIGPIDLS